MKSQKTYCKTGTLWLLGIVSAMLLSGCAAVPIAPGGEPFGEKTYSSQEAEEVYERVSQELLQNAPTEWGGYTIEHRSGEMNAEFYHSEEYTAAYVEGGMREELLWYEGCLYRKSGDQIFYKELPWDEIRTQEAAAKMWEDGLQLLSRHDAELTYKYIPMAEESPFLLKADYPGEEFADGMLYADVSVRMQEDGRLERVGLSWHYVEEGAFWNIVWDISFYPYEDSADLQAERRVWMFGQDSGLTQEVVPALSTQEKDREWCREVIGGMDFASLAKQARQDDGLILSFGFDEDGKGNCYVKE